MSKTITVGISELSVTKAPDMLVTYALGSCVGICLYDAAARIAGLSHIMLPSSKLLAKGGDPRKFADTALVDLIKEMELLGARRLRLTAKIAGGAQMFSGPSGSSIANIGARNIAAVKENLALHRIPIVAEDTGKNYGRTLFFYAEDGLMRIKSASKGEWTF